MAMVCDVAWRRCCAMAMLRATNPADYQAWITAIRPFASGFEEEDEQSMRFNEGAGDDDDDDSD